jgi:hypothetical protein
LQRILKFALASAVLLTAGLNAWLVFRLVSDNLRALRHGERVPGVIVGMAESPRVEVELQPPDQDSSGYGHRSRLHGQSDCLS